MNYERWFVGNYSSEKEMAMHLIVRNGDALIEHHIQGTKKDLYKDMDEKKALQWLKDRGWLVPKYEAKRRPRWIKSEGDIITGHPMVIGEL